MPMANCLALRDDSCAPARSPAAYLPFTCAANTIDAMPSGRQQKIVDRMFSYDADIHLEAIEVIAHRLRKKLSHSVQIRTLRGLGYVLEAGAT